jgi:hypothetical protein
VESLQARASAPGITIFEDFQRAGRPMSPQGVANATLATAAESLLHERQIHGFPGYFRAKRKARLLKMAAWYRDRALEIDEPKSKRGRVSVHKKAKRK